MAEGLERTVFAMFAAAVTTAAILSRVLACGEIPVSTDNHLINARFEGSHGVNTLISPLLYRGAVLPNDYSRRSEVCGG